VRQIPTEPDKVAAQVEGDVEAVEGHGPRVAHHVERVRVERRGDQSLDQGLGGLAPGSVGHGDLGIAELRTLGAGRLDDPEDPRLAIGFSWSRRRRGGIASHHWPVHYTTSRSRAKRP